MLLVLGTVVAYALHVTLSQWYLSHYPPQTVALYVVSLMTVMVGTIQLSRTEMWQPLSPAGWGVVLATGLISTVLARLAMFIGIQRIGGGQVALLASIETLLAVMWAILVLGERLSPVQWAGGLLILASAALALRSRPQTAIR